MAGQERPYTPISVQNRSVTLLIKSASSFSRWITTELSIGGRVRLSGPFGAVALSLQAESDDGKPGCTLHLPRARVALRVRHLVLVAGGGGITGVMMMLHAACARAEREAADDVIDGVASHAMRISVLVSDRTPRHALLVDELEALRRRHPSLVVAVHRV